MYSEDYNDPFRDTSEYRRPAGPGYSSGLAAASMALAVISIFSGIIIYVAVPCGALAVLLALLSRGGKKMPGRCKVSLALGAVGAVSSIIMTVGAFYMILTNQTLRSEFRQMFNYYADELGLDYDFDDMAAMFGIDSEDGQSDDSDGADDYYKNFWEEFYSGYSDGSSDGSSDSYSQDYSQDLPDGYDVTPVPDLPGDDSSDSIRNLPGNDGTEPIPDDPSIFSGGEFI